jgi:transcription factor E2F3
VQLKRKAPYGEAPVSGKSARTYKSKAKCSKPVPQTPISNAGKYKFVVL